MDNSKKIMHIAEELNDANNVETCKAIYLHSITIMERYDYNFVVMILGMCINKTITLNFEHLKDCDVTLLPKEINRCCCDISIQFNELNSIVVKKIVIEDDRKFFEAYLNDIVKRLLSGIKYIEKIDGIWNYAYEVNEWNKRWRREERIRDNMKSLITGNNNEFVNFTKENKIELPFLYALSWDIVNFGDNFNDRSLNKYDHRNDNVSIDETSYSKLLAINIRNYLKYLSKNSLNILFNGEQFDTEKFEKHEPNAFIKEYKRVSYLNLLPTLFEHDNWNELSHNNLADGESQFEAQKTHRLPLIKKEILLLKPLVPVWVNKKTNSINLLKVITDVLWEENQTKELNIQLKESLQHINKLNSEKEEMMNYYAHSWKHISYPKIVKDVAEALLSKDDDESITMANKLFRAYNSEQTLKHGIQLLQYSISSNRETVKKEFKKGFWMIDLPKEDGIIGIDTLLNESLDMVVLRLMMEDIDSSRRMKKCRKQIADFSELREDYTEKFLRRKRKEIDLLQWVNDNLLDIEFSISDKWKRVRIDQESFAAAQMIEILVELITNFFLHQGENAKIILCDNDISMDIIATNTCKYIQQRKGGKGLITLSKVVEKINFESNIFECVERKSLDNSFTVKVKLDKEVIYKD